MLIYPCVESLLYYAQSNLLLDDLDVIWARNLILSELHLNDYVQYEVDYEAIDALDRPDTVLEPLVSYAVENGIITEDQRELFGGKLMNIVCKRPAEIADLFCDLHEKSPAKAFEFLHDYGIKSDYIKLTKISQNIKWEAKSTKGKLEITINTCRPEKSNKATAEALKEKSSSYPACTICRENEGYAAGSQIRQTLRTVPLTLGGEDWFWQYSPYAYFNQHGICVNAEHTPMKVDDSTIVKLFDFVDFMPAYFIGCNAALPRIGGSVLTHDHFQGGAKVMPMFKAPVKTKLKNKEYPYIDMCIPDWYNSVLRLSCSNREKLIEFAQKVNNAWIAYNDESVGILANTGEQHSAITPIVRKNDDTYVIDIIFRNNRCDEQYPDGIFHAHPEYHNIKSESIGLIEAMGLFVLPGRLARQMDEVEKYITKEVKYSADKLADDMRVHQPMIEKLLKTSGSAKIGPVEARLDIKEEINRVCEEILRNTAVFKDDEQGNAAYYKFLGTLGIDVK
ncbi:MAG: UDP-glucose--hexose-1-phosphate uridylyltransferase [Clostridiales bacterium]|nr:UDP-glucose--hexose-1-phosphate uridylyltransferase [Clostridiales bacterium]